jgi:hypothetical protein
MQLHRTTFCWLAAICIALFATAVAAQNSVFEPQVGQPGKDVVWVPTSQVLVDRMLDMAKVTASDFVIDLGSGDGRTVITAAKLRGAPRSASNTTRTWSRCRSATPPGKA